MGSPTDKGGNIINFNLINGLKPNNFGLESLGQILIESFIDFSLFSLKEEILIPH